MRNLANLSLGNRALIALITLTVALFGSLIMVNLKQELIPSVSLPRVSVVTTYPGASPDIVDADVSTKIESSLQGLQGLENTTTTSSAGSSIVVAEFEYGTDIVYAEQRMQQAINRIESQLPEDAEWSVLSGSIDDFPIIQLAITGGDQNDNARILRDQIVGDLRSVAGVRGADIFGDRKERIAIELDAEQMAARGITVGDISDSLENAGLLIPAGELEDGNESLTVEAGQAIDSADDLADIPIAKSQISGNDSGAAPDGQGAGQQPGADSADAPNQPTSPDQSASPDGASQPQSDDEVVTIGDVAKVTQDLEPATSFSRVNGEDALTLSVTKRPSANTVEVSELVRAEIPAIEDALGDGVQVRVVTDQAPFVTQSIDTLVQEGLLGLGFAVLVIFVFLLSFRATLITAISIPVSLLITFISLFFLDYSLNTLTLAALTIAIGRVVDDSIVVVENIRRHLDLNPTASLRGNERRRVIAEAVGEVATAITASTLATVAVFLPVVFVGGMTGELFRPFALTNAIALLASLLVSLTIVPVLSYWFLARTRVRDNKHAAANNEDADAAEAETDAERDDALTTRDAAVDTDDVLTTREATVDTDDTVTAGATEVRANRNADTSEVDSDEPRNWLQRAYEPLLRGALARPGLVLIAAVLVLAGTGALAPLMKTNFLGSFGQTTFSLLQKVEPSSSLAATAENAREVERIIEGIDGVEVSQSSFGVDPAMAMFTSGQPMVRWTITTSDDVDPDAVKQQILDEVAKDESLGELEAAETSEFESGITVRVEAPDMDALREAEQLAIDKLAEVDGVNQVTSSLDETRPYIRLDIDAKKAAAVGLTDAIVGGQVAQALQPVPVGSVMLDGSSIRMYFVSGEEPPASVDELRELEIQAGTQLIPLSDLGTVEVKDGPAQLTSSSGTLFTELTLVSENDNLGELTGKVEDAIAQIDFADGARAEIGGVAEDQRTAFTQLGYALLAAILITYIVMVATLKSLLQPLLLMISVPFAATGAILIQVITGVPLGVASLVGVLMLIGVVVTNAIVLIDLVNQYRARGLDVRDATFAGATRRVRPIIMTALATILALTPMATGITGEGGFISQPMAIVVIGGLLSSTVLTLLVLPSLYLVVERALARRAERKAERIEFEIAQAGLE